MRDAPDKLGTIKTADKTRSYPRIMGIVNATPDSFSDGGQFFGCEAAIAHALEMEKAGAHILDIGGESTRPGATIVSEDEEIARVLPIIEGLAGKVEAQISIDTRKPNVALAAIKAGASIWNDVSALTYAPDSLEMAVQLDCEIILMHAQGDPTTMQNDPHYDDVVEAVYSFLNDRIEACIEAGMLKTKISIDPGIGFGKTLAHNLAIMAQLDCFRDLGCPVLLGASRKRFIASLDRDEDADQRLGGSLAAVLAGYQQGVSVFRVHDVAHTRQALSVAMAIDKAIKADTAMEMSISSR